MKLDGLLLQVAGLNSTELMVHLLSLTIAVLNDSCQNIRHCGVLIRDLLKAKYK